MPAFREVDGHRFWRLVAVGADHECWPWTGAKNSKGYGRFKVERRLLCAHRVAVHLTCDDPSALANPKTLVLHQCDNPPCCNPAHLRLGTASDNAREMMQRGRGSLTKHNRSRSHG
jgi:hypothetical protein